MLTIFLQDECNVCPVCYLISSTENFVIQQPVSSSRALIPRMCISCFASCRKLLSVLGDQETRKFVFFLYCLHSIQEVSSLESLYQHWLKT
jgi:hypothetical protein